MALDPLTGQLERKVSPFAISLKENRESLMSLGDTIERLEQIDTLVNRLNSKNSTVYLSVRQGSYCHAEDFQTDKDIFIDFLLSQRKRYSAQLAKLGIDSDN